MIRVMIVDDHAVVRQGLRVLLESQANIEVAGEASDGVMAVQMAQKLLPDVILMDLIMPGGSGIEAIQQLQKLSIPSRVLVLSSSFEDLLVKQALQAGAQGYVLKASRTTELIQAIERIAEGQNVLDPAAAQIIMKQVHGHDPLEALTARERETFDMLALGLNSAEIAARLSVSEATIRTHTASVLDKLSLSDKTQVIVYELKRGLIRLEDLP